MVENVDNLILEQLRLIRADLARIEFKFDEKIEDLGIKVDGQSAILIGLGKYIHDIDERVEHLEAVIGAKQ